MSGALLVFDFDHTIADLNTDVEVQKLAPGGEIPASSELRGRRRMKWCKAQNFWYQAAKMRDGQSSWMLFSNCFTRMMLKR